MQVTYLSGQSVSVTQFPSITQRITQTVVNATLPNDWWHGFFIDVLVKVD